MASESSSSSKPFIDKREKIGWGGFDRDPSKRNRTRWGGVLVKRDGVMVSVAVRKEVETQIKTYLANTHTRIGRKNALTTPTFEELICVHDILFIHCIYCFPQDDFNQYSSMDVDGPNDDGDSSNGLGESNLACPEALYTTDGRSPAQSSGPSREQYPISPEYDSYFGVCSRTFEDYYVPSPNTDEQTDNVYSADEHIEPTGEEGSIRNDDWDTGRETDIPPRYIQTDKEQKRQLDMLPDEDGGGSDRSDHQERFSAIQDVADSHERSTYQTQSTSSTHTHPRFNVNDERPSPGGDSDDDTGAYFTFVVHRRNLSQTLNRRGGPSRIEFNHGSHIHIFFWVNHRRNSDRTRDRIIRRISGKPAGFTESAVTIQRIKNIIRFILYLVRYGISKADILGARLDAKLQKAMKTFKRLFGNVKDEDIVDGECERFIEEKKDEKTRIGTNKRKNIVDAINEQLDKHNIKTYSDWQHSVDPDVKEHLLKEQGIQLDSYLTRCIKSKRERNFRKLRDQSFASMMFDLETNDDAGPGVAWLEEFFRLNNIAVPEFLGWFELIREKRLKKINGLVLLGATNAGKSMILDTMLGTLELEPIARQNDNSSFHLDQLTSAVGCIFEEPIITPVNVGTWKLLLEGKDVRTDIKHKDKDTIRRLPIFISTAEPLGVNVNASEELQLEQRTTTFTFIGEILHKGHHYTSTTRVAIPRPPCDIEGFHWGALYAKHEKDIIIFIHKIVTSCK
ncbi:Non-capsid protein NS-1 [Nymphon striatum]|nr:Non-capsid protein NS-1 [Nymphon striatum]